MFEEERWSIRRRVEGPPFDGGTTVKQLRTEELQRIDSAISDEWLESRLTIRATLIDPPEYAVTCRSCYVVDDHASDCVVGWMLEYIASRNMECS